ncbi:hypothetical protein ACFOZ1_10365 [Gracilibacillus marinus]|uniref:Cbb3-type cytochrome oxidase assembly protein CcoS n=1 Tax=Gracilibacillus marinus TaxID=630535 RepID=A0ABV8VUM1_9BACI
MDQFVYFYAPFLIVILGLIVSFWWIQKGDY